MPTRDGKLGVGVTGIGWCAAQHIAAFQKNPHVRVTWLHGRDRARAQATLDEHRFPLPDARLDDPVRGSARGRRRRYHLHRDAEPPPRRAGGSAARAGKHIVLEKPTGLDQAELIRIRDAVRASGVRTIVSFELRFNPYLKFVHWFRDRRVCSGELRFARTQYLSRVTDWYPDGTGSGRLRARPEPPPRRRVPCGRCPALVLGQGSGRGQRLPHALHRRLRVADVDPRQRADASQERSVT